MQVIAREEKGLWGVDYNRGEKTTFATSIQNRDQGRQVMKDGDGDGDGTGTGTGTGTDSCRLDSNLSAISGAP